MSKLTEIVAKKHNSSEIIKVSHESIPNSDISTKKYLTIDRITLKKVKYFSQMSHETNCFTADVYVDNILICQAENDGQGGSTHIHCQGIQFNQGQEYLKSIGFDNIRDYNAQIFETTCSENLHKSLNGETCILCNNTNVYITNFENAIDHALSEFLKNKEILKALAKFHKQGFNYANINDNKITGHCFSGTLKQLLQNLSHNGKSIDGQWVETNKI